MRVVTIGASGFIGSNVVAHGRWVGLEIAGLRAPRIRDFQPGSARSAAASWRRANGGAFERLCSDLAPFDVVINAAGVARPAAVDHGALFAANAVLPAVIAQAAQVAGVRRLVHVRTLHGPGPPDPRVLAPLILTRPCKR